MDVGIGRVSRASIREFIFNCPMRAFEMEKLAFGSLIQAPLGPNGRIYGVIADIGYVADELGQQFAQNSAIPNYLLADLRLNRLATIAISVLIVGYEDATGLHQELPPRPPIMLETISLCSLEQTAAFTRRIGYLEFLAQATYLQRNSLFVSHLRLAQSAQAQSGNPEWLQGAMNAISLRLRTEPDSQIWLKTTLFHGT